MRHINLIAVAGLWALAGCHDTVPGPLGPDTQLALHFDSLSAQANAASQANRVAALDLALRSLADGTTPSTSILSTGAGANDTATYHTVSWSTATILAVGQGQVTDSLLVFVAWRGNNADTMVVVRSGDTKLAPQVQSELATLGLTSHLVSSDTTDTLTAGALVTGNNVAVADSGLVDGDFGVFGTVCEFVTVASVANDKSDTQCNRELILWNFALRFSPSGTLGLSQTYSAGVVVVH